MTNTAQYSNASHTMVDAVIDDVPITGIPADLRNRHYRELVEGVPANEGMGIQERAPVAIAPYEADPAVAVGAQLQLGEMVDAEFLNRARAGVFFDNRSFSITPDDRNEIAGILEGARNGEALFGQPWGGMNAPNVLDVESGPYGIADLNSLVAWTTGLFALAAPLYTAWYTKKAEVRALTTMAEIDTYDVEAGWPQGDS